MNKLVFVVLLFVGICFAVDVRVIDPENSIESRYIIVFHEGVTSNQRGEHLTELYQSFQNDNFPNAIRKIFSIGDTYKGYSALLSASMLEIIKKSPLISSIEQDANIFATQTCAQQNGATWGIDRISEIPINLDGVFRYDNNGGAAADSYIIDTGIQINHQDFGGRALWGANFADTVNNDCNGHGTHVAGTVGGTVYGIAKKTTLIAVKVLSCDGSGTYEGVIEGIQWTVTTFQSRKRPSVGNMSLGGPYAASVNQAIEAAVSAGVTMVVAAGNENADACTKSPASAPSAISVGATGIDNSGSVQVDNRAYFSNYGKCTDIFAPGLQITSAWIGTSGTSINTISGTSMAAPHVAGMVALYIGSNTNATPKSVMEWLLSSGSKDIVQLDCNGAISKTSCNQSPNIFSYSGCGSK
jgi:subtilisin family serine protease